MNSEIASANEQQIPQKTEGHTEQGGKGQNLGYMELDPALTLAGSEMNNSRPCERAAVVYDICPAARTIELQQSRRQDSLRISASDQDWSQAGVEPHIGACSDATGQCSPSVN